MNRALVAGSVAALALYPPLYSLATLGTRAAFGHFAADVFYYFTVARNSALGLYSSFDGTLVTNGYHPLWQHFLIGLFAGVGPEQEPQIVSAFLASVALVAAGLALLGLAVYERTGSRLAPLWLVPGLFYVLFSLQTVETRDLGLSYTTSVWACMNAMESPLSVLFAGILIHRLTRIGGEPPETAWSDRRLLALGGIVALATLARLDDAFLALGFVAFFALSGTRRLRAIALVSAPVAACLLAYLAYNHFVLGMALPVSGQIKSGFWLRSGLLLSLSDFLPPLHGWILPNYNLEKWIYTAQRSLLIVIPAAFAVWLLARWSRARSGDAGEALGLAPYAPIAFYVIFKAAFVLTTIRIFDQGYWYFSVFILFFNFLAILVGHAAIARAGGGVRAFASLVWVAVYLLGAANAIHRVSLENWTYDVWRARAEIRAGLLAQEPAPKLIDSYDGLFAYSFDLPTLPGTGFAIDPAGFKALRAGQYLRYCLARGHDIAVWGPRSYAPLRSGPHDEVVYRHPATGITFTRLERAAGSPRRHGNPAAGDAP